MTAPEGSRGRVTGLHRFGWLTLFGATCAAAGGVFALTGRGVPCPFLMVTGWLCPVCGASRMGVALLHGDLSGAWSANPFVLLLGPVLALVWGWTGLQLLRRRSVALPTPAGRWLERAAPWRAILLIVAPGLAWMLVRNLF